MSEDASSLRSDERAVARRWMRLWQGADLTEFDELHAQDFVDHTPAGRSPSMAGFRQGLADLYRAFPDFRAEVDDLVLDTETGKVAIRWTASGTQRGVFLGRAPKGKAMTFRGIEIIQITAGRVTGRWGEWDGTDLLGQLGPPLAPLERGTHHSLTVLAVVELERAVAFYSQAFDWPVRAKAPVYVEFELPDGRGLGLYERKAFSRNTGKVPRKLPAGAISATELYFQVAELDAAVARIEVAGGTLLSSLAQRDWGDQAAYYADPDGNVLVLARSLPGKNGFGQGT